MQKLIDLMSGNFAKSMNKIARNPWVAGVQDALLTMMPIVLIGSIGTVFGIIHEWIPSFPNMTALTNYSFGLMGLFLAYLIPDAIMTRKRRRRISKQAGIAGIALFLMIINPIFDPEGNFIVEFGNLGSQGMIAAIVAGLFVSVVMNLFSKKSFFKEDTAIPDFITVWFDTLIPITLILVGGWILTDMMGLNIFLLIYNFFAPLITIGQSFWGFVLINFIAYSFLYSFGISTWILYPIMYAVTMQGFGDNAALIAAGESAKYIHVEGAMTFLTIGGGGMTLALNLMMLRARSIKVRSIGKATIIPSLANINEPIVFGAPMTFNPILMIPMWLCGLIVPAITYLVMAIGLVPIPTHLFGFWYVPGFIAAFVQTGGSLIAVLFWFAMFALSWVIYYPFFRIYDNQALEEESSS